MRKKVLFRHAAVLKIFRAVDLKAQEERNERAVYSAKQKPCLTALEDDKTFKSNLL